MEKQFTQQELNEFKNYLIQSICENPQLKQDVMESVPEYLKPYAHINPFAPDADKQVEEITNILHPNVVVEHPQWIQNLIDKGLVDTDGKTVIAKSLEKVALEIMESNIQVTNVMLKRFINGKTNKGYTKRSIDLAIEYANSK